MCKSISRSMEPYSKQESSETSMMVHIEGALSSSARTSTRQKTFSTVIFPSSRMRMESLLMTLGASRANLQTVEATREDIEVAHLEATTITTIV